MTFEATVQTDIITQQQMSFGEVVTVMVQRQPPVLSASPLIRSCLNGCVGAAKHLIGRCRAEIDALVSFPFLLC